MMMTTALPTEIEVLTAVDSTQLEIARRLTSGMMPRAIRSETQVSGKGRFERVWHDEVGQSLLMSITFPEWADHKAPWLIGMGVAAVAAGIVHCQLQWPNDLVIGPRKLGGVLTELYPDADGRRIPVIGIGINLNQTSFPEAIAHRATSLHLERGQITDAGQVAEELMRRLAQFRMPRDWDDLKPVWMMFDHTPGKRYQVPTGEIATAIAVGPMGELIASLDGETVQVMAADALFGPATP